MKENKVRDMMGNELLKDVLVTYYADRPLLYKVITVEQGGLHTPRGQSPALVRIVTDITLRCLPGMPFTQLIRVATPSEQSLIEGIADGLPKG